MIEDIFTIDDVIFSNKFKQIEDELEYLYYRGFRTIEFDHSNGFCKVYKIDGDVTNIILLKYRK